VAIAAVSGCSDCDVRIETEEIPDGVVGEDYETRLDSDCGGDSWFLEGGNLPPGIELRQDGDLLGTPTRAGIFDFTVGVVDTDGSNFNDNDYIAFKGFSMTVFEPMVEPIVALRGREPGPSR
jgi:hypothetical protein